jgi:UDP-N-acetylmuramate--alanine ligase
LAAASLALEEGVSFAAVAEGLAAFPGMSRRLERVGVRAGVTVIDDYAHHPAEVAAALGALRPLDPPARLAVVFQPHLYSRTRQLATEFAGAFLASDLLFVLPVYAAREAPIPGVDGDLIVAEAERLGHAAARFVPSDAAARIAASLRAGDVCVTMGAGDVGSLAPAILEALA